MVAVDYTKGQMTLFFRGGSKVHAAAGLRQAESTTGGFITAWTYVHCITPKDGQSTNLRKKVHFCRVMHANLDCCNATVLPAYTYVNKWEFSYKDTQLYVHTYVHTVQ